MRFQGFARKRLLVESRNIALPFGDTVCYKAKNSNQLYCDLDHLSELLRIEYILTETGRIAFVPDSLGTGISVIKVVPQNGRFKNQIRRAIKGEDNTVIIKVAAQRGNEIAGNFLDDMTLIGMKSSGITGAVLEHGKVIPVHESGRLMHEFSFDVPQDVNDINN